LVPDFDLFGEDQEEEKEEIDYVKVIKNGFINLMLLVFRMQV